MITVKDLILLVEKSEDYNRNLIIESDTNSIPGVKKGNYISINFNKDHSYSSQEVEIIREIAQKEVLSINTYYNMISIKI